MHALTVHSGTGYRIKNEKYIFCFFFTFILLNELFFDSLYSYNSSRDSSIYAAEIYPEMEIGIYSGFFPGTLIGTSFRNFLKDCSRNFSRNCLRISSRNSSKFLSRNNLNDLKQFTDLKKILQVFVEEFLPKYRNFF